LKKGKGKDYTNERQERGRGKGMKRYNPSKGKASFKKQIKGEKKKEKIIINK
jgi:hypothetical protein